MPTAQPALSRRKRVLIVDDEPAARDALARALSETYDVVVAGDGVEGVEMAAKSRPDLIVSDVTMPRLDGIAMVRQIREGQGLKVPVIFVTALGSPTQVIAGISVGARHYLTKPVDIDDLEQRIARALDGERRSTPSVRPNNPQSSRPPRVTPVSTTPKPAPPDRGRSAGSIEGLWRRLRTAIGLPVP
jgi:two-component system response regulator MprA